MTYPIFIDELTFNSGVLFQTTKNQQVDFNQAAVKNC